jgi:tetratricopeptide (TPR) repeat protein
MKKVILIFSCLSLIGILIYSCERKISPGISVGIQGKGYDSAAFDFYYVEAIKQKLMGNNGDALEYLELCIKINKLSDAVYYQMAQIIAASGDFNNAKNYLKKALFIEPKNLWYMMMLSSIYYQSKDLDSAIIYYEKATRDFPKNENLKISLGKLYSEKKDYEKAVKIFEDIDKRLGVNETSTVYTIKNLISANRYLEAEERTKLLLKEFPDEVVYNGLLAEIYHEKGENEKAIEVYNNLVQRNPDNPQIELALCDFLINSKKYDDLLIMLNQVSLNRSIRSEDKISLFARILEIKEVIKTRPEQLLLALKILEDSYVNDDIIPLLRTDFLVKSGKLKDASTRLEEIIKVNKNNYYAWEKLLIVYLQEKEYTKLEQRGEECATMFNRSFLAKLLYANGAMENKNYDVALEELRKATILAGDDKDLNMQILTMKADIYYRMKDFNKAFETFEEGIRLNKDDLTILNNYAYYLAEQDINLKEAESMSKLVIEKERKNTAYLDTYGWILYKRGKMKAAGKVMEEIINSGEPPDAVWYEHYGYVLKKQRNCKKAVENWKIALKLDSSKKTLINEIENCKDLR